MSTTAKAKWVIEATVIKADGTRVPLGVVNQPRWRRALNLPLQLKLAALRRRQRKAR